MGANSRVLLASALLAFQANAAPCSMQSGPRTAALVELYTSEGCSSGPPAERWLSTFDAGGVGRVVPLALHVDYWDGLGWKDPYARHAFALRQRRLADLAGERFVYTPQVLLQGRAFRGWDGPAFAAEVKRINAGAPGAGLALALQPARGAMVEIEVRAELLERAQRADAALYIATFQDGLTSVVAAGENRGRTLRHDYVVRDWIGPLGFGTSPELAVRRRLKPPPGAAPGRWGVAAFVQNRRNSQVLQALLLPACAR
ncbi:MAG TPA: DUF1223 domain-containing protein [Burkholderiales bacterium]|nr:DUF1223 domain-containing protein [Burkholderiales bacterium]